MIRDLSDLLSLHWPMLLPLVLGGTSVYLLLPRARPILPAYGAVLSLALIVAGWLLIRSKSGYPLAILMTTLALLVVVFGCLMIIHRNAPRAVLGFAVGRVMPAYGAVAGGLALVAAGLLLIRAEWALPEKILFYTFAGLAVVFGALMITQRNAIHAALSFAMVVLSTCGLFLLQAAPFLMAATIIIYAGAIVVTFLFVIMLAQQAGLSDADQRSREPFLATLAAFVLLGALLFVLDKTYGGPYGDALDHFVERTGRAAKADSVTAWQNILGKDDAFFKEFRQLVAPGGDLRRGQSTAKDLANALGYAQLTWNALLPNAPGDPREPTQDQIKQFKEELAVVRQLALQLRQSQGSLMPSEHIRLGAASVAGDNQAGRFGENGKPVERLPAANVAGLGKTLFTDYLLAVELAGTLLLVATIGAIAIAGRRGEGLR